MMNDRQKSDCCTVAMKAMNKPEGRGAELPERRRQAEGNTPEPCTRRTQSRISVSQGLERVRERATARKQERFTGAKVGTPIKFRPPDGRHQSMSVPVT